MLDKLERYRLSADQRTNGDEGTTRHKTSLACESYAHLHDPVWQGFLTVVEATTKVAAQYTEVMGRELGVSVPCQVALLVQQGDHLATCLEYVKQRLERLEGYVTVHAQTRTMPVLTCSLSDSTPWQLPSCPKFPNLSSREGAYPGIQSTFNGVLDGAAKARAALTVGT